jgi:hypothetical protein
MPVSLEIALSPGHLAARYWSRKGRKKGEGKEQVEEATE